MLRKKKTEDKELKKKDDKEKKEKKLRRVATMAKFFLSNIRKNT